MAFMGALATACLDQPPTYTAPVQSPPIILGNKIDPPTHRVKVITLASQPTIEPLNVPFRSIDAGESLIAIFFRDFDPTKSQVERNLQNIKQLEIPADSSPLDEQLDRKVTFDLEVTPAGCRTMTLQLSHKSNFPIDPTHGIFIPGQLPVIDQDDVAQVTWFFDVRDPTDTTNRPSCWGNP